MKFRLRVALVAILLTFGTTALASFFFGSNAASAAQVGPAVFNGPTGIATCGSHVWVTNASGNSVTELNKSNGEQVQVISSASSDLSEPMGVAGNGTDLWVANLSSNSVSEIDCATGSSIRSINSGNLNSPVAVAVSGTEVWVASQAHLSDPADNVIPNSSSVTAYSARNDSLEKIISGTNVNGLNGSSGISVSGGNVWITNANGNSVTELDAKTGHVKREVEGDAGKFKWPMGVASTGADVWVENLQGNSLTEVNESTGTVRRVVTGDGLDGPDSICVHGKAIWVTNLYGNSVTELNSRSGSLIRVIQSKADGFSAPTGIAAGGSTVWVTNQWSNTVTELEASSGSLRRIIR